MSGDVPNDRGEKGLTFDLEERTARLGEAIIDYVRTITLDDVTSPLVRQLVRSSTSIGANYCEADEAGSKKEFRYRIGLCKRESRETKFWLRMMARAWPAGKAEGRRLYKEVAELTRIFAAIQRNS